MSKPSIVIVVARGRNGIIGREGGMPWHLPSDLRHFKAATLDTPVIMGRKTFQSIGRPLPGRVNIVVSRSGFEAPGTVAARDLAEALAIARATLADERAGRISVIGGGEIYRQAMDFADELLVTEVDAEPDGDTVFPEIDPTVFSLAEDGDELQGAKDSHAIRFTRYERRKPAKS